jgi:hypothetical protein
VYANIIVSTEKEIAMRAVDWLIRKLGPGMAGNVTAVVIAVPTLLILRAAGVL